MSRLVGKDGVDFFAELGLVNAQVLSHILGHEQPIGCMHLLLPDVKVAQVMLVVTLNLAALNRKELP